MGEETERQTSLWLLALRALVLLGEVFLWYLAFLGLVAVPLSNEDDKIALLVIMGVPGVVLAPLVGLFRRKVFKFYLFRRSDRG